MSYVDETPNVIPPVEDFATDWDFADPAWVDDPYPIWEDLRSRCPVPHSERFNEGAWLAIDFDDVVDIANRPEVFSSLHHGIRRGGSGERGLFPPINTDPPEHHGLRRTLLPFFAPKRIEQWRSHIQADCEARVKALVERGHGDAAVDYSQHIPVGAIASILGINPDDGDRFRSWIDDIVGVGANDGEVVHRGVSEVRAYMATEMERRRANPGDDLISHLVQIEYEGAPLSNDMIERMLVLQLVAGIDTTWSSIGAALWHLATHPDDRRRLVAEPDLLPVAIEELLRAYAPVSLTRVVTEDVTLNGADMSPGDHILISFPGANRDPSKFEQSDEVVIDRARNRHIAFGVGIHRCLGSNLARLEMNVAVSTWLEHIPEFSLAPDTRVEWSTGQIRGPRSIPFVIDS